MHLRTTWFGSFLLDGATIVEKRLFPQEAQEIALRLKILSDEGILDEEKDLATIANGSDTGLMVAEQRLLGLEEAEYDDGNVEIPLPADHGFSINLLHDATLKVGSDRFAESITPDMHLIQAVNSLEDLQKTTNLLMERIRDWYGLHFPQLENMVDDYRYIKLIRELGDREAVMEKEPDLKTGLELGGEITESDLATLKTLGKLWNETKTAETAMERHIISRVEEIAPNMSGLIGPVLAARLIAIAGGLNRLARMPSSTIQLLGAEKALFRSLKEGSRGPKHGIIFLHPLVNGTPYWARGKAARALAGKVSVAARVDSQAGEDISAQLKNSVEKRVASVREQAKRKGPPNKRNKGGGGHFKKGKKGRRQ